MTQPTARHARAFEICTSSGIRNAGPSLVQFAGVFRRATGPHLCASNQAIPSRKSDSGVARIGLVWTSRGMERELNQKLPIAAGQCHYTHAFRSAWIALVKELHAQRD